jgi:hypothetical protein
MPGQNSVRLQRPSALPVALACIFVAGLAAGSLFQLQRMTTFGQRTIHPNNTRVADSDLFSPWIGTIAALHGQDPYSASVTEQIQVAIYGRALLPSSGWDPQAFVYPAYIVFLLGPFTLLSWPKVYFLFALLGPLILAAAALAWLPVCLPGVRRTTRLLAVVLVVTSWPALWSYNSRQPSMFVVAAIALSVLLYSHRFDTSSGFLLALATVKPHLVLLLCLWVLPVAAAQRRWRFIAAFALTLFLLVVGSLVLVPHWISHWIRATIDYSHHSGKTSLLIFVTGRHAGPALALFLLLAVLVRLWKLGSVSSDSPRLAYAAALLLSVTACLVPSNVWLVYNNLLLIPGVLLLFHRPSTERLPEMLRRVAQFSVAIAFVVAPLCAAISAFTGFSVVLALLPSFVNFLLPIPVTAALLAMDPGAVSQVLSVHPAGASVATG